MVFIRLDRSKKLWYYKIMNRKAIMEEIKYLENLNRIVNKNATGSAAYLFEIQTARINNKINELKNILRPAKKRRRSKK